MVDIVHDEPADKKQPESVYEITLRALYRLMNVAEGKLQSESDEGCNGCIVPDKSATDCKEALLDAEELSR